ncbi:MAG TPA: hypothetical protein PLI21_05515 [Methanomassiliicoccaceae archaeon]|nr:hypothetical protein [Euryarchaeota archaeon]HOB38576.1 hypothetical protein [Methanomassiliicoccaceae archaeon]HOK28465.1 hypothetical protein [Methanomassiliicoccaceae archaeon]HOL07087.1 hypothetical protein [Methanomassiliicoccaceae archaeon]HOQ27005.1 hypothetical protein [Methanomassiliicoccaceae archaeon]
MPGLASKEGSSGPLRWSKRWSPEGVRPIPDVGRRAAGSARSPQPEGASIERWHEHAE